MLSCVVTRFYSSHRTGGDADVTCATGRVAPVPTKSFRAETICLGSECVLISLP